MSKFVKNIYSELTFQAKYSSKKKIQIVPYRQRT